MSDEKITRGQGTPKSFWREAWEFVKVILIALVITNLLNIFVFTLSEVRQSSMEQTLMSGEQLIVEKLSYQFGNPKRGDIVVFIKEMSVDNSFIARLTRLYDDLFAKFRRREGHFRLVKRVIGVPGDKIEIIGSQVYVNDELIEEAYLGSETSLKAVTYPLTLPEGKYFVMGDNRRASYDSRDFGPIDRQQIEGRAVFRFWPFSRFGLVNK